MKIQNGISIHKLGPALTRCGGISGNLSFWVCLGQAMWGLQEPRMSAVRTWGCWHSLDSTDVPKMTISFEDFNFIGFREKLMLVACMKIARYEVCCVYGRAKKRRKVLDTLHFSPDFDQTAGAGDRDRQSAVTTGGSQHIFSWMLNLVNIKILKLVKRKDGG